MGKLLNIGYGNIVNSDKIVSIISPDSAPIKRLVQGAKDNGTAIDATQGRKTRAVITTDSGHFILSALLPETIAARYSDYEQEKGRRGTGMETKKGNLIVVSGFSGAGKGTLMKELLHRYDCYALSISATTRKPRERVRRTAENIFKTKQEFENMIAENQLIEYAQYVDNYYGTPKEYVENQRMAGKDVILEIEIQGALKIKKQYPDVLLIFVMAPSPKELKNRLVGRGTEGADVIEARLKRAAQEAEHIEEYDYILVNDDLEESVRKLHQIIQVQHNLALHNINLIENMRQELKGFVKGE